MSSYKIDRFEILLNSPDHTFLPGEIITGQVIVEINKPISLRSLKLRFKGKADVHWEEDIGTGDDATTKYYKGEELYFRKDLYLLGEADGDNLKISEGFHSFPFEYGLPRDIPSSYKTKHGSIRYTIKAIMDRPWNWTSNPETSTVFTVETPHDLTQSTATIVIDDEGYESFDCFPCIYMGNLKYNIFLPSNGFTIGDVIQAKINLNNASTSVDVTCVALRLNQAITLLSQHTRKTKTEETVVQTAVERQLSKTDEVVLSIQVPSLPYSGMVYCSIIDIKYYLTVVISVDGCQRDIKKKYPIIIGSKPALRCESVENPL